MSYVRQITLCISVIVLVFIYLGMCTNNQEVKKIERSVQGGDEPLIEKNVMEYDVYSMSLKELNEHGYIEQICEETGMNKTWFDNISTTESTYGKFTPDGLYNAWGWGIYGNNRKCMGNNWYDASKRFAKEFVDSYGTNPSKEDMRRYCPIGAYDKYF